jgi:hypothetical protein
MIEQEAETADLSVSLDDSALSPERLRSLQNLKPWRPGQSGNPAGSSRGQREAGRGAREARRLAREGAARAVRRLIEPVDSTDERVAAIAAQAVLERASGSARRAAGADDAAGQINISQVDP